MAAPQFDTWHEPGEGRARASGLPLFAADWSKSASQAWMVTFTDLVALMLTFFVLLFAMSQVEQRKWQGFVHSLTRDFDAVRLSESVSPAAEYQPEEEAIVPGADLDYLAPVLRQQLAAHPLLARSTFRRLPERLIVSLPAGLLYRARGTALAPRARELGFALGGVLRNLSNRIEVAGHVYRLGAARARRADWELALARAALFTGVLSRAGYRGPIVAQGIAGIRSPASALSGGDERDRLQDDRIDVVIHELANRGE